MFSYFKERRKREKKPLAIIIIALVFFSLPFFNYFSLIIRHNIAVTDFVTGFERLTEPPIGILGMILLFLPFAVGAAILSVRKWGWYFFISYAISLIIFNVAILIKHPSGYNIFANIQTLFLFSAIIYFMQKNISAPYMDAIPRGWRMQNRKLIEIPISINGQTFTTKDIGDGGLFVKWPDCDKEINEEFTVSFNISNESFNEKGAIVRKNDEGAGVAFREITNENKTKLKKLLKNII